MLAPSVLDCGYFVSPRRLEVLYRWEVSNRRVKSSRPLGVAVRLRG